MNIDSPALVINIEAVYCLNREVKAGEKLKINF